MASGGKRGPYREYLRNTEMMPRRMRLEVEEAIYREKELPKDSEIWKMRRQQTFPFFSGHLATVTEKQVSSKSLYGNTLVFIYRDGLI